MSTPTTHTPAHAGALRRLGLGLLAALALSAAAPSLGATDTGGLEQAAAKIVITDAHAGGGYGDRDW
jgi:hypothetical protein